MNKIKNPSREEYREKVLEYFELISPLFESYPDEENFKDIIEYVKRRKTEEVQKIKEGINKEVEKRYNRYVDYG